MFATLITAVLHTLVVVGVAVQVATVCRIGLRVARSRCARPAGAAPANPTPAPVLRPARRVPARRTREYRAALRSGRLVTAGAK